MERWMILRKGADFEAIGEKFHISPRLACLIRNRGVIGDEAIGRFLNGTASDLHDGRHMKGMEDTVRILRRKIEDGKKIRIIGDYDIDGINATYILLEGIERLGGVTDSDIPDRVTDGYGLNVALVKRAYEDGIDTIVTCDNGIAAADEIAYGKSLGMTMIVTDHHEVPYEEKDKERIYRLPPADAVIDPKQQGCMYPFSGLCGAAVAYQLVLALCADMDRKKEEFEDLLENVAIATVGDVMDLTDENRILVKEGLNRIGSTQNYGLRALIECTNLDKERIRAYHVGFILGPCMNASGRLDTAKRGLELLRAKSKKEADVLAGDLKALNSRKEMTEKAVLMAKEQVEEYGLKKDRVLVIYLPSCHESLAGIVAGRVRESYYRPVFVLTDAMEGIKGSGRSIETYHMYEELSKCKEILTRFGGHRLAAGLSMEKEKIETFRRMLNENCTLTEEDMTEKVVIDMELPFAGVTESFIRELSFLEPFGKGNTKPVFAQKDVHILNGRIMGKNRNVGKYWVTDGGGRFYDMMYFGDLEAFHGFLEEKAGGYMVNRLYSGERVDIPVSILYYPDINRYGGRESIQIVMRGYR